VVSATPLPLYPRVRDPVPFVQYRRLAGLRADLERIKCRKNKFRT